MKIKVLVVKPDGSQYVEEREVPENYFDCFSEEEKEQEDK